MLKYHWFLYYFCDLGCFGNRRLPEGLVPIIDVCVQKSLKNVGKHSFSWKAAFCWSAIVYFPFLYKQLSKSTSQDSPGRPLFNFFGRWIFTRYSEIVTFSIWGPSGRPPDRARAGAFSGTLSRPFFVKPWGDFDGNPQLILTIPFWSLFGNRFFYVKNTFREAPFWSFWGGEFALGLTK